MKCISLLTAGLALALACSFLTSAAAQAAGPARPADTAKWSGFYLGAHAGGMANVTELEKGKFSLDGVGSQGVLGGAQAGYLFQFGSFVFGLEVDGSLADVNFDISPGILNAKVDQSFGAIARFGVSVGSAQPYLFAGYRQSKVKISVFGTGVYEEWLKGPSAGAGIDFLISRNFSLGLRYAYVPHDDENIGPLVLKTDSHVATLRANYLFGE